MGGYYGFSGLVTAFRQARVAKYSSMLETVAAVKNRINPLGRVVVDHTRGCTETGLVDITVQINSLGKIFMKTTG